MKTSTHIIRLGRTLALAAFVAGAAVPAALAGGNAVLDGRSPDTRDAALAAQVAKYGPRDGWYGYAVSLTKSSGNAVLDGRSPDTHDAALAAQIAKYGPRDGWYGYAVSLTKSSGNAVRDGRSPDTVDAALLTHTQVVNVVSSSSFDWGDFGVGVAAAFGVMLFFGLAMRLLTARQSRKQPSPVATA